jgi:hypothetical protein
MKAIVPGPRLAKLLGRMRLDAAGYIDQDRPCGQCGYNLRGLRPEGRCPECGTDVATTLTASSSPTTQRVIIGVIVATRLIRLLVPVLAVAGIAVVAYVTVRKLLAFYTMLDDAF